MKTQIDKSARHTTPEERAAHIKQAAEILAVQANARALYETGRMGWNEAMRQAISQTL